jgi:hypothetical protein
VSIVRWQEYVAHSIQYCSAFKMKKIQVGRVAQVVKCLPSKHWFQISVPLKNKNRNPVICDKVDEPGEHHAKWKKESQVQKDRYCIISFLCGVWSRGAHRNKEWMMAARGWRWEVWGLFGERKQFLLDKINKLQSSVVHHNDYNYCTVHVKTAKGVDCKCNNKDKYGNWIC